MFGSAFNVMLPAAAATRAIRSTVASLPQTFFQRTIIYRNPWIQDQEPVGFEDVPRRFKDLKTQTAYDRLIHYLSMDQSPWKFAAKISPPTFSVLGARDRTLTFFWGYGAERVLIRVYVPDDDDEPAADSPPVRVLVNTFRYDYVHLGFGVRIFDREMKIDHVSYADEMRRRRTPPRHHVFCFRKHLDGAAQAACYEHLELRGVKPCLDYQKKHVLELYHTLGAAAAAAKTATFE